MSRHTSHTYAKEVADLTFDLLANCQLKEQLLADQFHTTVPEFRCLRVFRGQQRLPVSVIVERLRLSASRVTRILASLEGRGFLKRIIDPLDRRNIIVELTAKGLSFSKQLEDRYVAIHQEILEDIPNKLQPSVAASLQKLLASVSAWLRHSSQRHSQDMLHTRLEDKE